MTEIVAGLRPRIIAASDDWRPHRWWISRRRMDCYLLAWTARGRERHEVGRRTESMTDGTCYCIPAGIEHALHGSGNRIVWVHCTFPGAGPHPSPRALWGVDLPLRAGPAVAHRMRQELPRIVVDSRSRRRLDVAAAHHAVAGLFLHWARSLLAPDQVEDQPLASRMGMAEAMARERCGVCGVDDLARVAGLSRARFSAIFVDRHGAAPGAWLRALRLEHAAELLHSGDMPVADIAVTTGYADSTAFGRAFRQHFSISPLRYRHGERST